jgi:hypothetical protein
MTAKGPIPEGPGPKSGIVHRTCQGEVKHDKDVPMEVRPVKHEKSGGILAHGGMMVPGEIHVKPKSLVNFGIAWTIH